MINALTHLFWGAVSHTMMTENLEFNPALIRAARSDVRKT